MDWKGAVVRNVSVGCTYEIARNNSALTYEEGLKALCSQSGREYEDLTTGKGDKDVELRRKGETQMQNKDRNSPYSSILIQE